MPAPKNPRLEKSRLPGASGGVAGVMICFDGRCNFMDLFGFLFRPGGVRIKIKNRYTRSAWDLRTQKRLFARLVASVTTLQGLSVSRLKFHRIFVCDRAVDLSQERIVYRLQNPIEINFGPRRGRPDRVQTNGPVQVGASFLKIVFRQGPILLVCCKPKIRKMITDIYHRVGLIRAIVGAGRWRVRDLERSLVFLL